jgi:DNA-binding NtrC family response regulator
MFELATGGTLFLDEIGELPLSLQAKLLRVLQEREIQRVGGVHTIPVDIRLVAATNRSLRRAIAAKEFREDLYYRLNVIEIKLPPLRERRGDVAVLADHFLQKICRRMHRPVLKISHEAIEALEKYSFPGNIRELENVMERCVVLCDCDVIELEDIPQDIRRAVEYGLDHEAFQSGVYPAITGAGAGTRAGQGDVGETNEAGSGAMPEFRDARDAFEKDYLQRALDVAKGNVSEASRATGLSRRHFYEKMDKLGMRDEK